MRELIRIGIGAFAAAALAACATVLVGHGEEGIPPGPSRVPLAATRRSR